MKSLALFSLLNSRGGEGWSLTSSTTNPLFGGIIKEVQVTQENSPQTQSTTILYYLLLLKKTMNWFTWLSKTNLDPSLVHEYALVFAHNELGEDDIAYFTHEFLQSMGIYIAKHRLEILKAARKEKNQGIDPVLWLVFAVTQTKRYLAKHIRALVHRDKSALSLVSKRSQSLRWKVAMLQRNKRLMQRNESSTNGFMSGPGTLLLTSGTPIGDSVSSSSRSSISDDSKAHESGDDAPAANPWTSSFSSTTAQFIQGGYWSSSNEEIKWDSMFQNLKPT